MILSIIQARMGSSRLPGKMMKEIEGKTLIWHVINRVKQATLVDKIILATTNSSKDAILVKKAKEFKIECFAGSEDDVLDRYYQAARKFEGDAIVRITGDCPLVDPHVIDEVIRNFLDNKYDYVCNVLPPTYPDGLDTEVISFKALERTWKEAKLQSDREHVTTYIRNNPSMFKIKNVINHVDLSTLRWTVDQKEDLEFVREIYRQLYNKKPFFNMEDVLEILEKNPNLNDINTGIQRNEGYLKSLKEDKNYLK